VLTDSLEFEGRPHLAMAADGWEEIAASIEDWLDRALAAPAVPAQGAEA
jgi:hypothetical protein